MKKVLAVLICVIVPLIAGTMTRTATFASRDLSFTKAGGYDVIDLAGYPAMVVPGAPRVPRVVQSVAIPAGATVTGVELLSADWADVPGVYNVGPAQADAHFPRAGETYTPPVVGPDAAIYASSSAYPATVVLSAASGTMAGYRIANVELHPVRFVPATGRLQLATRVSYRLTYTDGNTDNSVATVEQQKAFGKVVRSMVVNPTDVSRYAPRVAARTMTTLPPGHYEYVVITEAPMDTVFQRLAAWKSLRGVPGNVVLVSWINTNYTGYDLQEKIRNFIKDAYATWGTMYVLLGGQGDYNSSGQNIVPTRMADYESDPEPCDLYYAGLDGTWDANNNHTYGEVADGTDMYSDVYVGRAPVYNVAMAQNFVAKVLHYEQNPPAGYLKKMLLPTGILWDSYEERPMQESIARMTPPGWVDGRLYERTGALSHQATMDSINAGIGMSHWDGHGNESGIYLAGGSVPFFESPDADALTNGDKTGMAISIACDCGAWDWVSGGDCLAEHMVNRVGGGFIATMMNSRYGYGAIGPGGGYVPGPSERLDTTYFSGVIDRGLYHTGEALGYSKGCWAPYADSLYQYDQQRYCIYDLNLIGDPETPLWTDEPTGMAVTAPGAINIGNGVPCPVSVSTETDAPIANALVVLQKGDEVNVSGHTDGSGQVTLLVSALTPGPMTLIVSAQNHFTTVDTVMVIASSRYVSYLRSTILDPAPGGNDDSIMNPGEAVKVSMWLKNWGQQTANTVTACLRTHDANALITDSVKTFGSIAAGDSATTGTSGFGLSVNVGLANGYVVPCSLIVHDALDSVWVSTVSFIVGAPVLVKQSVAVCDSARGNGNGRLDAGEESDLEVTLQNTGLGHGYNCQATLVSGDARLVVTDADAAYGTVRAGQSVANSGDQFVVSVDAAMPLETPVTCTLHITANGGYTATQTFVIVVGEIRSIDPIPDGPRLPALYYAYDDTDEGYAPHPTYEWAEIRSQGTRIPYPQNDDVIAVTLPSGFGPFKFYGQRYTQISVSADGWIAPGNYTTSNFTNTVLPDAATPPGVICANWDDLYPDYSSSGYVYWYHDAANHRLIVEYDSVAYYNPTSTRDKFEVIISDTTVVTPSGDNEFTVQYKTAAGYSSSTLGIENPARSIAIQSLFNATYHRGCATIAAGRAIKYTTVPPAPTGIADEASGFAIGAARFSAWPNPFKGGATIAWNVATVGQVTLRIYDASGRAVRTLVSGRMEAGRHTASWNGRDGNGRTVAAGVYFYELVTPAGTTRQKVTVAH